MMFEKMNLGHTYGRLELDEAWLPIEIKILLQLDHGTHSRTTGN
jgi:hypothetical protein